MATFYSNVSNTYQLILELTEKSQSIAENLTELSWVLKMKCGAQYYQNQNTKDSFYFGIDNTAVYNTSKAVYFSGPNTTVTIASGTQKVGHNADGTRNISIAFSFSPAKTASYYPKAMSGSTTMQLTTIPRAAKLVSAPHFTDEENPTITYSNPAGNVVTSLQACIANAAGTVVYADYRDISKTGTNYTFSLTDEERNALRWATINSPNLTVKFYVTTMLNGVRYESTLDKIMTIANAEPTLEPTIKDTGASSTQLTGDANKIIKGHNYIDVKLNANSYKGASIKSQQVVCGGQVLNSGAGGLNNVESGTFVCSVTDSRGHTTTKTITKELINYIQLTCNMTAENPNAVGETRIEVNGNYFNGSFGAVNNTLEVQFRYKENDEEYSEWIAAAANISGNTYNAIIELDGLNYQSAYTFQARAIDKVNIAGINSIEKKVKSIPVFEWGENDFKFNVPAYDKNGNEVGTELTANDYDAAALSGKSLLESGWVTITPKANEPTAAYITFKRHYNKKPVVLVTTSSGVIGTQVLGASTNGITNDGANIVITRTNTTPTSIYYYVFGEVDL